MKVRASVALLLISVTALVYVGLFFEAQAVDDVTVLSTTIYQTYGYAPFSVSKGDYIVAGEVMNRASEAVHFNITATFYDASNSFLGSASLSDSLPDAPNCYLHVLLPGKKSPFAIWLSRSDENGNFIIVDHYDLAVSTSPAGPYHTGFELVSNSSHETGSTLFADGALKNIGTAYLDGYNVLVTWYKGTGEVLAVSSEGGGFTMVDPVSGEKGLAPNQTCSYSVALNGFNEGGRLKEVAGYEVTAEGYEYSLWTNDGQLTSPEVSYVLGTVEQEGQTEGTSGLPLIYLAVVAALILAVVAVLIFALRKRRSARLENENR